MDHIITTPSNTRDRFLMACAGREVDRVPVWFMRQAGRSLPEYRKLREKHSILELCRTPELAAEATLQPLTRLGVDAAILFSDIVVALEGLGVDIGIEEGIGPVVDPPVRSARDVERLQPLDVEMISYVPAAVRTVCEQTDAPVIGFAGAPFTLACYLVDGGPSKDHAHTKALMYSEPAVWHSLMDHLAQRVVALLRAQIEAGATAVQLFDSWAGLLSPDDYAQFVQPAVTSIMQRTADLGVPRIYFGLTTGELLPLMAGAGCDVIGVDWRVPLDEARRRIPPHVAVQGNLDPAAVLAPTEVVRAKTLDILRRGRGRGHIFNLGHGVLPETNPDALKLIVDVVHGWSND